MIIVDVLLCKQFPWQQEFVHVQVSFFLFRVQKEKQVTKKHSSLYHKPEIIMHQQHAEKHQIDILFFVSRENQILRTKSGMNVMIIQNIDNQLTIIAIADA